MATTTRRAKTVASARSRAGKKKPAKKETTKAEEILLKTPTIVTKEEHHIVGVTEGRLVHGHVSVVSTRTSFVLGIVLGVALMSALTFLSLMAIFSSAGERIAFEPYEASAAPEVPAAVGKKE